jgi:hypothetical protein
MIKENIICPVLHGDILCQKAVSLIKFFGDWEFTMDINKISSFV